MADTMNPNTVSVSRLPALGATGYLLAVALLGPFFSPLLGIWGPEANVGSVLWRFGAYGLIIGALFYLFCALAVAAFVAGSLRHRRTLLALGAIAALLTLLLVAGLPPFVLDFLQLRRSMGATAFGPFRITGIKVLTMAALGIPVLGIVAFYLVRAGKALEPDRRPGRR